jgi:ATP-dependent DNA helicase DinG
MRRLAGGGTAYDDRIIRARLAQAFGRLIRKTDDHGHFVLLSPATPSRLLTAFPQGTPIHRVTLDEAVGRIKSGLSSAANMGQGNDELIADEDIPF